MKQDWNNEKFKLDAEYVEFHCLFSLLLDGYEISIIKCFEIFAILIGKLL